MSSQLFKSMGIILEHLSRAFSAIISLTLATGLARARVKPQFTNLTNFRQVSALRIHFGYKCSEFAALALNKLLNSLKFYQSPSRFIRPIGPNFRLKQVRRFKWEF